MKAYLLHPDSLLWKECLSKMPHDFYHMPEYVQLCARNELSEPLAFVAEQDDCRLFMPLIVRAIHQNNQKSVQHFDATSPYGYSSPLLSAGGSEEEISVFLENALESLMVALKEKGVVSLFVRFHPLLSLPMNNFCSFGDVVNHGETVYIDLTKSNEELWSDTRSRYRSKINRAERTDCKVELDNAWNHLDEFIEIYYETMTRVNASDYYFFSRQYFLDLKNNLDEFLHLALVRLKGDIIGAGLFSEVNGIMQYHLSGMRTQFASVQPTVIMLNYMRIWAKKRGNRFLHLGGGVGANNDSLMQFKSGFSKCRGEFLTWRAIVETKVYNDLVTAKFESDESDNLATSNFFPAYR